MVVRVARRYHQLKLDFCIITFYDPQRAAIIRALENEDLPYDCVYNVDSFQGNEADYVILSSVRTKQPGFLKSQPRMNVALTRCRKGMVVVTDKSFLQGAGGSTLLGQLCHTWSRHHACWIDSNAILNNSGALPGLPGPAPSRPNGMQSHSHHNLSARTTMPPRNPPSQSRTRTRTNQEPVLERLRHVLGLSNLTYQPGAGGGVGHWHVGARSAATAVRRNLDDDEFPSLQPLATALDPTQSSRQRSWEGRR